MPCKTDTKSIAAAIAEVDKHHDMFSGNCGAAAVGLNRALGNIGIYVVATGEWEHSYFHHVALKIGGRIFDGSGRISKRTLREYALDAEDDQPPVVAWLPPGVDSENTVLRRTEGGGTTPEMFEHLFRRLLCK